MRFLILLNTYILYSPLRKPFGVLKRSVELVTQPFRLASENSEIGVKYRSQRVVCLGGTEWFLKFDSFGLRVGSYKKHR